MFPHWFSTPAQSAGARANHLAPGQTPVTFPSPAKGRAAGLTPAEVGAQRMEQDGLILEAACSNRSNAQNRPSPAWCFTLPPRECHRHYVVKNGLARVCELHGGVCELGPECGHSCNGTVAYAFITQGKLPLWPVWSEYLSGCPKGSVTTIVHSQAAGATLSDLRAAGTSLDDVRVLQPQNAVNGSLRFSWKMIQAMMAIVRVARAPRPYGQCTPRWIHFSSASCAPIRQCVAVHAFLQRRAGASFVLSQLPEAAEESGSDSALESANGAIRLLRMQLGVQKGVQWMTLWGPHAERIAQDEAALRVAWAGRGDAWELGTVSPAVIAMRTREYINISIPLSWVNGAVDELLWPNELARAGFSVHKRSLTWASWNRALLVDLDRSTLQPTTEDLSGGNRTGKALRPVMLKWGGSPMAFDSAHAIGWVCEQALQTGHAFARKFVGTPSKTIDGLRRCLRMAQKQSAGIHLLGGGRFKGKLLQGSRYRSAKCSARAARQLRAGKRATNRTSSAARQLRAGKRATNRTSPNRTSSNRTSMAQRWTAMLQRHTARKMDREWRGLTRLNAC